LSCFARDEVNACALRQPASQICWLTAFASIPPPGNYYINIFLIRASV